MNKSFWKELLGRTLATVIGGSALIVVWKYIGYWLGD